MSGQEEQVYDKRVVDTDHVKCDGCGANMEFDPKTQQLVCRHCGKTEKLEKQFDVHEVDLLTGLDACEQWDRETVVFRCENCGAKVLLERGQTARCCPFCGTAHVVEAKEQAGIKPTALLPFAFDRDIAVLRCKEWAKKGWLSPRKFRKSMSPDNINGVYTPCFTFDSHTFSRYEGRIGKTHTRTVGSGKNRRTETYIVWRHISGTYDNFFDDIVVTAGNMMSQKNMDALQPYDTNNGCKFEEDYMLGFMAYRYERGLQELWGDARDIMDQKLRAMILSQYSYDHIDYLNVSTDHDSVTYKYVMLPVWVGNYTYGKKLFNFYVNGTTGKVTGKRPYSPWKILILTIVGIALVLGLFWLFVLSSVEGEFVIDFLLNRNIL